MNEECLICGAPLEYLQEETLMECFFCHKKVRSLTRCVRGHYVHTMVGAALLTAYRNAGGEVDLEKRLMAMLQRGKQIPGGVCGFWGACGAGISTGIFVSLVTGASPLATDAWGLSNLMTSKALGAIGEIGGPRCCKRDSYLAILSAVDFAKEHFGVEMEKHEIVCSRCGENNQCITKRCPFHPVNHRKKEAEEN